MVCPACLSLRVVGVSTGTLIVSAEKLHGSAEMCALLVFFYIVQIDCIWGGCLLYLLWVIVERMSFVLRVFIYDSALPYEEAALLLKV